jgi:tetratricopeptide repeat family protein
MIYREQGDFHKALKLIEDEKKIVEEHFPNDNLYKAVNNYEQGYVRFKLNNLDEALTFMNLSLEQSLETDDVISQACSYRGLGEIYLAFDDTQLANMHFEKAIELFKSVDESEGIKEIEKLMT